MPDATTINSWAALQAPGGDAAELDPVSRLDWIIECGSTGALRHEHIGELRRIRDCVVRDEPPFPARVGKSNETPRALYARSQRAALVLGVLATAGSGDNPTWQAQRVVEAIEGRAGPLPVAAARALAELRMLDAIPKTRAGWRAFIVSQK